jgi:hypothetical protein
MYHSNCGCSVKYTPEMSRIMEAYKQVNVSENLIPGGHTYFTPLTRPEFENLQRIKLQENKMALLKQYKNQLKSDYLNINGQLVNVSKDKSLPITNDNKRFFQQLEAAPSVMDKRLNPNFKNQVVIKSLGNLRWYKLNNRWYLLGKCKGLNSQ